MRGTDPLMSRMVAGVRWRASAVVRTLPDFLILGAQKAGTTSLYDSLCDLPEVLPARKKEVRFFDRHWERGVHWYRWNFPARWATRGAPSARITGEATPDYLVDPRVPERVAALLPSCKLLVLLRDPVDRAYSQYRMNLALGVESRPFRQAIEDDLAELGTDPRPDWDRERGFRSYVERSRYAAQLERWFAEFPHESIHVTTLEALLSDTAREMKQITDFLGLEVDEARLRFPSSNQRTYQELSPADRHWLFTHFERDVECTSRLLDLELPYCA